MIKNFFLTDEQYEHLSKCISLGVGIGIFIGMFTDKIILMFSLGGVIGIVISFIRSIFENLKTKRNI